MSSKLLSSVLKLSHAECILLVEQIWDSVAETQESPPLTTGQKIELDARLTRIERSGPTGSSWEEVKKRIKRRKV